MARKKKKADPKKESGAEPDDSVTSASEGEPKKSAPKKKRTPKKKRARKKADKEGGARQGSDAAAPEELAQVKPAAKSEPGGKKHATRKKRASKKASEADGQAEAVTEAPGKSKGRAESTTAAPVAPEPREDEPVEDLDAALDLDADTPDDIQSLVAVVASLDEVDPGAEDVADIVVVDDADAVVDEPEEEAAALVEVQLEDVDAVLDDEMDGSDDLEALIALTAAGSDEGDRVDELPIDALDEDLPMEVLDGDVPVPALHDGPGERLEASVPPSGATPASQPDVEAGKSTGASGLLEEATAEQDLEGAIDLGPVSTPELRDRLLAQALAHSELQEARYRVPYADTRTVGGWKVAAATLLFLAAAVLAVAPPGWVRPEPPAQIDAQERVDGIRTSLLLQAQQVDAYRVRFQRLPNSLDELHDGLPGLRFVRSGNRAYQLIGYEPDGNAIIYDSSNPGPVFERITPVWATGVTR